VQQALLACPWLCEHSLLLCDLNYCSRRQFKAPEASQSLAGKRRPAHTW
jgi:hypothetical protein